MTTTPDQFDASAVVALSIPKLTAALSGLTVDNLKAVADAENAKSARTGALEAIGAELKAREAEAEEQARIDALAEERSREMIAQAVGAATEAGEAENFAPVMDCGQLVLIDDDSNTERAILIAEGQMELRGKRLVYLPEIVMDPRAERLAVTRVVLFGPDPNVEGGLRPEVGEVRYAVPLVTGGGRRAKFPAASLSFAVSLEALEQIIQSSQAETSDPDA